MEKITAKRVVWKRPGRRVGSKKNFNIAGSIQQSAKDLFYAKYSNTFIPGIKDTTPKEELTILLKIAAEVEHTLLIQYLYAAYTISDKINESALKRNLVFIAVQEMGHLLAVQNLLLGIGGIGNLHLAKNEFRLNGSEKLLPYTLERFSKDLLAKFVAVEAPIVIPPEYLDEIEEIHKLAKDKAGIDFNPVGGLYMKIFWLFQKDDNPDDLMKLYPVAELKPGRHISDSDFIPVDEIKKYEANYKNWDLSGGGAVGAHKLTISSVYNGADARKLVAFIADQGEGADMSDIDSHFERFFSAYRSFDQKPPNVIEAPLNPVSVSNSEFKEFTKIENEYTLKWVSLMNIVYTSLLLDIHSSMFYFELSPEDKDSYLRLVFTNMSSLIKLLSQVLFKLPLNVGAYQANAIPVAAPTFEIDPDFRMATSKAELNELNNKFLNRIVEAMSSIKADPGHSDHIENDTDAGTVFYSIQEYHDEKLDLLQVVLL